jgi:hypothetical protein
VSDNLRDTQFSGFATLLLDELVEDMLGGVPIMIGSYAYDDMKEIIARRAYDLVEHSIRYVAMLMANDSEVMFIPRQDGADFVSDMTEWPKEE